MTRFGFGDRRVDLHHGADAKAPHRAHQIWCLKAETMDLNVCKQKYEQYRLLAEQACEQARFDESEEYWWQAVRQAEDAQSPQMVCMCLDGLGDLFTRQGRHQDSEPLYRESLRKKVGALGESHPIVARGYNNLAFSLYKTGKIAEAEHSLRQALMIFQDSLGLGVPEAQWSARHLVRLLKDEGKIAEAAEMSKVMDGAMINDITEQSTTGSRIKNVAALCEVCRRPYKGVQCLRCTQKGMSALRSLESSQVNK
ncbi:MAG TPA: tetratricopeptide repeat protein [Drouetiella sp.]